MLTEEERKVLEDWRRDGWNQLPGMRVSAAYWGELALRIDALIRQWGYGS